jgi:quinol monooxygenase YgiN
MLVLIAELTVAEGKGAEVIESFKGVIEKIRKDPGTIAYNILQGKENPDKITVLERYENMEALQLHGGTEHFKAWQESLKGKGLFTGRPTLTMYDEAL